MTKELKQQYTLKITQANKTQLVVILYEMFLIYVEEARQAHEMEDRKGFREGIRKSRGCLKKLHEAYQKISEQDTSQPVMVNTQTVYAGLTYGKNTLTENLSDQGSSRGFRA